jgi:7-cyano-7-deazaguanine synthase
MLYEHIAKFPDVEVHALSFNYGQRHKKELEYAARTCAKLEVKHDIVDLSGLTHLISNSALTSQYHSEDHSAADREGDEILVADIEVPEGHYAQDSMAQTIVPNRNMIMLAISIGVAVNEGAGAVFTAVHAGDHFIYPDCRPMFLDMLDMAARLGNEGAVLQDMALVRAPYILNNKKDIAVTALTLQVPLEETWSCYKGGEIHCGRCGTCVERLEAIHQAQEELTGLEFNPELAVLKMMGVKIPTVPQDLTEYEDTEFWKTAGSYKNESNLEEWN